MSYHTQAPWPPVQYTFWWELKDGPCYTDTNVLEEDGRHPEEVEANARLAAAAPELLAACETALSVCDFISGNYTRDISRDDAHIIMDWFAGLTKRELEGAIRKATKARGKKAGRR